MTLVMTIVVLTSISATIVSASIIYSTTVSEEESDDHADRHPTADSSRHLHGGPGPLHDPFRGDPQRRLDLPQRLPQLRGEARERGGPGARGQRRGRQRRRRRGGAEGPPPLPRVLRRRA